jgi:hypothetical protein
MGKRESVHSKTYDSDKNQNNPYNRRCFQGVPRLQIQLGAQAIEKHAERNLSERNLSKGNMQGETRPVR